MPSAAGKILKESRQFMVLAWIVAGILAVCGILCLTNRFRQLAFIKAFDTYQTTGGTILRSEVRNLPGQRGESNTSLTLRLSYGYEVDGIAYVGQYLSPQQVGMTLAEDLAEPFHRQFPVGKVVQVHFDRAHPDRAFLLRSTGSNLRVLVPGLILCAAAVGIVLGARRLLRLIQKD